MFLPVNLLVETRRGGGNAVTSFVRLGGVVVWTGTSSAGGGSRGWPEAKTTLKLERPELQESVFCSRNTVC
jgi:hypothetical protein